MSVSSINSPSAPLPFNYLDANNTQPAAIVSPVVTDDTDSNDASPAQPPALPPLPPGQGTRINQLV
jgi:hypothetical protein